MLVLTRGIGDRIVLADDIVLTVVRIRGQRVKIGFEAPPATTVRRAEIWAAHQPEANAVAVLSPPERYGD